MMQLRQNYQQFVDRDAIIIVIGPDNLSAFQKFWKENSLPFIGLPDPEHKVLMDYGQEFKLLKMGRMPAQVIIDRKGMVRYVHYGESMSDIPSNDEILRILDEINENYNHQD